MKQKPLYWKSTHFAASVQYLNFIAECIIFPLALILYISHYQMNRNLYQDWDFNPINYVTRYNGTACPENLTQFFDYDYPEVGGGCDCGVTSEDENGDYDYSKLHLEHCLASQIDEGCDEVATIPETYMGIWNGSLICGSRSEYTYRQLFYDLNCTSICRGVCVKIGTECGDYDIFTSQENLTQSFSEFTLGYSKNICYEEGDQINTTYPFLEQSYTCAINSTSYAYIDSQDQYEFFEENNYNDYKEFPGIDLYTTPPQVSLFGVKFAEYNCSLKQIDIGSYRDNYIQLVFLVALIMAGCLIGFGAIFHSAIIQNLSRKGIFKHKIYKVTWKFYCPTTFLILLHMAHFAIVLTKLTLLANFRSMMKNFITKKCTDWSSILDLVFTTDFIDDSLLPLCIPELVLTFVAMLLEILQLCLFDRRLPETIQTPTLKGRDSPAKTNNFAMNFGISEDNVDKNILDTDNIRISNKNEQLKLYND